MEVVFTGEVVRGTDRQYIQLFALPASHRPKHDITFVVATRNGGNVFGDPMYGIANITVNNQGMLIVNRSDDMIISLEGIRFISENQ
jgi:hypothetical protein